MPEDGSLVAVPFVGNLSPDREVGAFSCGNVIDPSSIRGLPE
jgi:hypothetical protein